MPNLNTIVGKFGAGKTSTAVDMMLAHIAKGGVVASNINLRAEPFISNIYQTAQAGFVHALKKLYNWTYKEGQFIYLPDVETVCITSSSGKPRHIPKAARFWEHIPRGLPDLHVLVFIDEAHKVWPKDAYSFMPTGDTDIISVMRHLNIELFWMTQHQEHVWVDLRRLNEDWYFLNNLKKGGLGLISRWPAMLRPFIQVFCMVVGLLLRPLLGRCPDVIRIRRFRSEDETAGNSYAGYPKYKRYSQLVLQSYDSPRAVDYVRTDDSASPDFRSTVPVAKPTAIPKKLIPVSIGFVFILFSVGSFVFGRSGSVPDLVSVPVPASNSIPVSAVLPVAIPLPVRSDKPIFYKWLSVVNGRASICLESGDVICSGESLPDSPLTILTVSDNRLLLSDRSVRRLVKLSTNSLSAVVSSRVPVPASGSGSPLPVLPLKRLF